MHNVVNFADFKQARRIEAETKRLETAKEAASIRKAHELAEKLGGGLGAQILAAAAVDLAEEKSPGFVPAYCLPSNEQRGAKYEGTKDLNCKEIAARIRQDIKDAIKAGILPKGLKVSCAMPHYGSIEVRITALPESVKLYTPEAASWKKQVTRRYVDYPGGCGEMFSPEFQAIKQTLEEIHGAYNRDNSDSMSDYFDRRYYGMVSIHYALRDAMEAAEVEASPGNYWHESCFK